MIIFNFFSIFCISIFLWYYNFLSFLILIQFLVITVLFYIIECEINRRLFLIFLVFSVYELVLSLSLVRINYELGHSLCSSEYSIVVTNLEFQPQNHFSRKKKNSLHRNQTLISLSRGGTCALLDRLVA